MTATWRNREELEHQVVALVDSAAGLSRRDVARALGVSRNTVRSILVAHAARRASESETPVIDKRRAPRASNLDAFAARIAALLVKYPDITAQRVFETLTSEGFGGGYTAVKRRVRALRPKPKPSPSLPTPDYGPAEMAECDWSPYTIEYTTGRREVVQAFSYVSVYSRRKYVDMFRSNGLHALMDGHVQAFARFGGVVQQCKYDSQKPVVLRWEGEQPIYNPRFLAFATYYEFRPLAVRRGRPNDKPRVERSFWEAELSFLNGRSFHDFDDLRRQVALWLDTIVDHRRRRSSMPTALERFESEREALVPLPRHAYDTARMVYRLCSLDGFVAWDGNEYAVPYDHITDIVPVRITQRELFVYAPDLRCVARHELALKGQGLRCDPQQLHPPPGRQSPLDLDQVRAAFERMGSEATEFFRLMSQGPARQWGFQARQILRLRELFATSDIDAALGHARSFGAFDAKGVARIVAARSPVRTLDEYVAAHARQRIEKTLGAAHTPPRDLADYDRLPGETKEPRPCPSAPPETQPPPPSPLTTDRSSSDSDDTSNSSD